MSEQTQIVSAFVQNLTKLKYSASVDGSSGVVVDVVDD